MKFDREVLQVLCPYGEWPHANGIQVVDEKAARKMLHSSRIAKFFYGGVPIYIGHPDDSKPRRSCRVVGKIKRICLTKGGIAVVAAYGNDILKRIESGEISAMSPRWQMESTEDGKFRPVKLISVGLTNNPNISGSGRIISAFPPGSKASRGHSHGAENFSKEASNLADRARKCVKRAEGVRSAVKEIALCERVAALKKELSGGSLEICRREGSERRIRHSGMAELARERSVRLGEPYVKSFAAVRKEYI